MSVNNCIEGTETSISDMIHDTFHVEDLNNNFFQFQETAMPRKSFNKMKYHFHRRYEFSADLGA